MQATETGGVGLSRTVTPYKDGLIKLTKEMYLEPFIITVLLFSISMKALVKDREYHGGFN